MNNATQISKNIIKKFSSHWKHQNCMNSLKLDFEVDDFGKLTPNQANSDKQFRVDFESNYQKNF